MVDVMIHIDENASSEEREAIRDALLQHDGVDAAAYHSDKPHLMMVEYNPDTVSAQDLLNTVKSCRVHAELIGL